MEGKEKGRKGGREKERQDEGSEREESSLKCSCLAGLILGEESREGVEGIKGRREREKRRDWMKSQWEEERGKQCYESFLLGGARIKIYARL